MPNSGRYRPEFSKRNPLLDKSFVLTAPKREPGRTRSGHYPRLRGHRKKNSFLRQIDTNCFNRARQPNRFEYISFLLARSLQIKEELCLNASEKEFETAARFVCSQIESSLLAERFRPAALRLFPVWRSVLSSNFLDRSEPTGTIRKQQRAPFLLPLFVAALKSA